MEKQLYSHRTSLLRFARHMGCTLDVAEDLVQETFLKAIQAKDAFADGTNLKSWLMTILKRLHINNIRTAKRRQTFSTSSFEFENGDEYDISELNSLGSVPPAQESPLILQDLAKCVTKVNQVGYRMLELVALEGMSYEDIAAKLNVPEGTVKSNVFRVRHKLIGMMA